MKNRYEKIVLLAEKEQLKCVNPPIPEGYYYVEGKWYNGYVIERFSDNSQFVWIPVEILPENGTRQEGTYFVKKAKQICDVKFGKRDFGQWKNKYNEFFEYFDPRTMDFINQIQSVNKYGGFYISRYNISDGNVSKPYKLPLSIEYEEAEKMALQMERTKEISSHLTFGAEYDSIIEWFICSGARSIEEIEDSRGWGHSFSDEYEKGVLPTATTGNWCTNNIYDFSGNVSEYTQERYKTFENYTIRGGNWSNIDYNMDKSVAYRAMILNGVYYKARALTGFRVALCIK